MSFSCVETGIRSQAQIATRSVAHKQTINSQAVTLIRCIPAALILFALAMAGVANNALALTVTAGIMAAVMAITLTLVRFCTKADADAQPWS